LDNVIRWTKLQSFTVAAVVPAFTGVIVRMVISTMGIAILATGIAILALANGTALIACRSRDVIAVVCGVATAGRKCRARKGAERENGNGHHKKLLHGCLLLDVRYQRRMPRQVRTVMSEEETLP
jgi:hypothetical protein